MKGQKNLKVRNSVLVIAIFIATVFMSIGYASSNNVVTVTGTGNIAMTHEVLISSASSASNDSTINSFSGTMLNSTVDLTNNATQTFTITISNNTTEDVMFDQVLRDTEASLFYSNQNITFDINGLSRYDILLPSQSITFTITFHYVENFTPSTAQDRVLNSYINFKFKKGYSVTYNNINTTNQNYDTIVLQNDTLVVNFNTDVPYDVRVKSGNTVLTKGTDFTYEVDPINSNNMILTVPNVTNNLTIDRCYHVIYNLYSGTNNPSNLDEYLHGTNVTFLDPTRTYYEFDGWYDNSSYTGNSISSINNISSDTTLYAKWRIKLVNYIYYLTSNYDSSYVGIMTSQTTVNGCTNTFAYDHTVDNNLRYIGPTPCNYIKFNCANNSCENWRIIGVMYNVGTGPLIKIVRNDSVESVRWHQNKNNWANSEMRSTLIDTYLPTLQTNGATSYMVSVQWGVGGVSSQQTAASYYTSEMATKDSSNYVGLMAPSDLGFAVTGANDTARNTCLNSTIDSNYPHSTSNDCRANNWMNFGQNGWTAIPQSSSQNRVIAINSNGYTEIVKTNTNRTYRPAVYLSGDVYLETGDGSSGSPYELE